MTTSRWIRRGLAIPLAIAAGYGLVLARPHLLFAHEARAANVVLHTRTPLTTQTLTIAAAAQQRISRSPFYSAADRYDVFICDTPRLFAFFAPVNRNVGGVADVYLTQDVFLRPAHIERDRLVGPSGREAEGDRTLTYFVAHEIAHIMTVRALGRRGYFALEPWQREGYADYVGKGGAFDFEAVRRDYKAGANALDPARSGLYLRYHLLVAHLLDHKGMTPAELLSGARASAPIEAELAAK